MGLGVDLPPGAGMRCKTCVHWTKSKDGMDSINEPFDEDTFKAKVMPFEVNNCQCPALLMNERPLQANGFCVADASDYRATLHTAENFGCIHHKAKAT